MSDGKIRELDDVKHVPELNINLISFGMLYKMRCLVKFESWTLKVPKGSIVLMKSVTSNELYILKEQLLLVRLVCRIKVKTRQCYGI